MPKFFRLGTYSFFALLASTGIAQASSGPSQLPCDMDAIRNFQTDELTKVVTVRRFIKGEALPMRSLAGLVPDPPSTVALDDLCLVKLLIGPGNPGPLDAPSTSQGIGVEIWLPRKSNWNGRLHAIGSGGWVGSEESDRNRVSSYPITFDGRSASEVAAEEGEVTVSSDAGHASPAGDNLPPTSIISSFALLPDGSYNTVLLVDFASRAVHEMTVKAKAVAQAYYGRAPDYAYFESGSNGGRQAMAAAQRYPADFDGLIAGFPAMNLLRFGAADLYPQLVIQRDLGGKHPTAAQLNLVSNAAINACDVVGGIHLGYILDPKACHYDAYKDPTIICAGEGGSNQTPSCLTRLQARAINKVWYGVTSDGSVPDPARDNGTGPLKGKKLSHGLGRGTNLLVVMSDAAFPIAADLVALQLGDVRLGSPLLRNATGNGEERWKSLTYGQFAKAVTAGKALQPKFGYVDANDPDLSKFRARGGKLLLVHGTADELIPHEGSIDYYEAASATMGGYAALDDFFRLYLVAGMGHSLYNGTANPAASPPMPQPKKGEMYRVLIDWVEQHRPPANLVIHAQKPERPSSLPLCAYPTAPRYRSGDPLQAASFACEVPQAK
jgi:feruloyl esterase